MSPLQELLADVPQHGRVRWIGVRPESRVEMIELDAKYTKEMMDKFGPEGGAYGANSGGFDQLGYGSLLFNSDVK